MNDKTFTRLKLLATCVCVFCWVGATNAQQVFVDSGKGHDPVTRTFNAANNETIVSVVPDFDRILAAQLLAGSPEVQASPTHRTIEFTLRAISYKYNGTVPARPHTVDFVFISDGRKPKYKDTGEFRLDADGSVTNGKIDYSLKDSSFGQVEVLMAPLSPELFLRIAHAAKVQFSFGAKTYKLSDAQKKDMRALAETVP